MRLVLCHSSNFKLYVSEATCNLRSLSLIGTYYISVCESRPHSITAILMNGCTSRRLSQSLLCQVKYLLRYIVIVRGVIRLISEELSYVKHQSIFVATSKGLCNFKSGAAPLFRYLISDPSDSTLHLYNSIPNHCRHAL